MNKLVHPKAALKMLSLFHRKDFILYVEGKEDKTFWQKRLEGLEGIFNCKIKDVGKGEITRINKFVDPSMKSIVCLDSDVLKSKEKNPLIVYTYGYSIENTLYCPRKLSNLASIHAHSPTTYESTINQWYQHFCQECDELITYDLANEKAKKGIKVMGNSSHQYLHNKTPNLCKEKVKNQIDKIKSNFSQKEIKECKRLLRKYKKPPRFVIRGHFLTSAVLNLIKKIVRDETGNLPKISKEHLYAYTIDGCLTCMKNCKDRNNINKQLKTALSVINIT